ncbi:MAG: APC family permease [Verrucomicrobiota bacterium]|nr:APC family permease [Verrucomicrobiota bacterium]MDQ3546881.1 APC family permease [Verrucomicrobiota bacterium]
MKIPAEPAAEAQLVRALGVPSLAANIVNSTVGAGIFALPALVAAQLGSGAPLAFLLCAAAMVIFVTSFALAGSRVSLTGGLYAYVESAFGRYVGFIAGVLYFLTAILASSGIVALFADTIGAMAPIFAHGAMHFLVVLLVFGTLAWINIRGVQSGARAVWVVTIAKLVPLLIFVVAGIFFMNRDDALTITWPGAQPLGRGVLLLLFAFVGIEVALMPSGEVKDSSRTVPRAIYLALGVTTVLYLLIQLVAQGLLGDSLGKYSTAPLAQAASRFLGEPGRNLMLIGASISAFGFLASDILSSPRVLFAFGRDRFLPKAFAHVHPRFRTPDIAILVYCAIAAVLSLSSTFQQLAILSNVAVLVLYFLSCGAALRLMKGDAAAGERPFDFAGSWIFPVAGIAISLLILAQATRQELTITGIVVVAATVLFVVQRAIKGARA